MESNLLNNLPPLAIKIDDEHIGIVYDIILITNTDSFKIGIKIKCDIYSKKDKKSITDDNEYKKYVDILTEIIKNDYLQKLKSHIPIFNK